jgi:hypothetical protein
MQNIKTALAVAIVMLGLPLLWVAVTFTANQIITWLHVAGLDWLFGAIIIATIIWLYIRIVAALWK